MNDSRAQTSSLVAVHRTIPPWAGRDADRAATVLGMREIWSRFDVEITEVDPGPVAHLEAILGGSSTDAGRPADVTARRPSRQTAASSRTRSP